MKPIDITGSVFGRLTVISPVSGFGKKRWLCKCSCGNESIVVTNKLTSGATKSCGCLLQDVGLINGKLNRKHGQSRIGNPTYKTWTSMRQRVKENYHARKHYFDRLITVCSRWDSYENFVSDMGERPIGTTLDRINVNGNYEPSNCRWATNKTQQRNKRNTNYLNINGNKVPSMDVADKIGVKKSAMAYYINVSRKLMKEYGYLPTP